MLMLMIITCLKVLVRRELEEAAKVLGERIRTNDATCEVSTETLHLNQC